MNSRYSRYYIYIKPIIKNTYVKTYSSLVFSLIAITFFGLFAIRPTIKTILALQKDIEQQSQILQELTQKSINLEKGRENYQAISPSIKEELENLVPDKAAIDGVISSINTIALSNQASISGLQIQPIDIETASDSASLHLKEIALTFNLQGDYSNLLRILSLLPISSRLFYIDTININKIEEDNSLIMSVNARSFYLR